MKQLIATAGLLTLALSACAPATTGPGATSLPFKQGEVWELNYTTALGPKTYTFTVGKAESIIPQQNMWGWSAQATDQLGLTYVGTPPAGLPYVSTAWYPGGTSTPHVCAQVRPVSDGTVNQFKGIWTTNTVQLGDYMKSGNPAGLPACTLTRIKPAP